MQTPLNLLLVVGASLSACAALGHIVCIVVGGPAFRLLGAGERLARQADRGHWYPAVVAFCIGAALAVCSAYALSAAGVLPPAPLTRVILTVFSLVLVVRAVAFPLLMSVFPENSMTFWLVSSSICLAMGLVHAVGLSQVWASL